MAIDTTTGNPTSLDPTTGASPFPTSSSLGTSSAGPDLRGALPVPDPMHSDSPGGTDLSGGTNPQRFIERVVQGAHQAIDKAASVAVPAVDRLSDRAHRATAVVNDRAGQLGTMQDQWLDDARTTVRHHPIAAVAGGLAIGWLIGRLTAR